MKRTLSLLLAVTILCGLLATGVFAAGATETVTKGNTTVTLSDVISKETKTVTINGESRTITLCLVPISGCEITVTSTDDIFPGEEGYFHEADGTYTSFGADQKLGNNSGSWTANNMEGYYDIQYGPTGIIAAGDVQNGVCVYFQFVGGLGDPDPEQETATPVEPAKPAEAAKPVEPAKPADTAKPTAAGYTYTVQKGDTLASISVNFYGSYAYAGKLQTANSAAFAKTGGKLNAGMTLTLPEKLGNATRLPVMIAAADETLYTVKNGDCLWNLAYKYYGDGNLHKTIYTRNKDRIASNYMIYVGQVIVIPAKPAK